MPGIKGTVVSNCVRPNRRGVNCSSWFKMSVPEPPVVDMEIRWEYDVAER